MWYSTRQEGFDDPRHTLRGPFVDLPGALCCAQGGNSYFLRGGAVLQLFSLTGLFISYWSFGGTGLFGYELEGMSEVSSTIQEEEYALESTTINVPAVHPQDRQWHQLKLLLSIKARSSNAFQVIMAVMAGIYMVGASYLVCFQAILADDACWARGYRAGSKILRLATFMDLLSSTMQFIFYLYISKFYSAKWYTHFLEGGSERIFFSYIRCMHALACLLFACAYYLLEVYHDEGAGDLHAYINASLFGLAGSVEFSVLFVGMSGVAAVFIWVALAALSAWACFFEPEVNEASPALYETELTNDVEQQVEKFARMSPYYPTESEGAPAAPSATLGGGPPATATSGPMLLTQEDVAAKAS